MTWARRRETAQTLGDRAAAFASLVWEAESWVMVGDFERAFGLALIALSDVPTDAAPFEKWLGRKLRYKIQMELRPEKARLLDSLAELEELASRSVHPVSDLDFIRGMIACSSGAWEPALEHLGRGWHRWDRGWTRFSFAWHALNCCLRLDRREEADSWLRHLSLTQQDWKESRQMLKAGRLLCALHAGDRDGAAACIDDGCGWRQYELRGRLFAAGAASDPLYDPSDHSHPARGLATPERTQSVHVRYDNVLALVDYRLACLRFGAGLPAADDLYYRNVENVPTHIMVVDPIKFQQQLRSFHVSWSLLAQRGRHLDILLECDWRTREANTRLLRAKAIAAAAGFPFDQAA